MPNIKVVDMAGKEVGEIALSEKVFGKVVNEALLHTAVRAYLMNQRQGTQSTLTRTEVSGGGKNGAWDQERYRRVSTEENGCFPVLHDRCPSVSKASFRRRKLPNG